jgi:WD40 repeat protein
MIDTRTGRALPGRFGPLDGVDMAVFRPDGKELAVMDSQNRVSFWATPGLAPLGEPLDAHVSLSTFSRAALAYSPNGDLLASAGGDNTIRILDARTHRFLGGTLTTRPSYIVAIAFSQDGRTITVFDATGQLTTYPADPGLLTQVICERVGRSLSPADWKRLIPDTPYQNICP